MFTWVTQMFTCATLKNTWVTQKNIWVTQIFFCRLASRNSERETAISCYGSGSAASSGSANPEHSHRRQKIFDVSQVGPRRDRWKGWTRMDAGVWLAADVGLFLSQSNQGAAMAFPEKDALLVPYSTNFNSVLENSFAAYDLTVGQAGSYSDVHLPYIAAVSALDVARANGTRSEQLTAARDTARGNVLGVGRQLYGMVSSNAGVSNEAKIALGVHVRRARSGKVAPKFAPTVEIAGVSARTVSIKVFDATRESRRGKAKNAAAAWLYTFVGEDYPSDPAMWSFMGATSKYSHQITFPNSVLGGTKVWVMAAWVSQKQLTSPPSLPVSTYLQGGGSVSAQSTTAGDTGMKIAA